MKNKMSDLHNHLFEQLERLNDDDLKGEDLSQEIKRANAMSQIAMQIISNGNLVLKATIAASNAPGDIKLSLLTE